MSHAICVFGGSYIAVDVVSKDEEVFGGVVVEEELDGVIEFGV